MSANSAFIRQMVINLLKSKDSRDYKATSGLTPLRPQTAKGTSMIKRIFCVGMFIVGSMSTTVLTPARTTTASLGLPRQAEAVQSSQAAVAISASSSGGYTCALLNTGGVKCWGGSSLIPEIISGLDNAIAISVGGGHICAVLTTGGVKCWGGNTYGQLGNNSTMESTTPVDVTGLTSGVIAISAGVYHTCAVLASGGVKCWGRNDYGQLGNNTRTDSLTPVDVGGLSAGATAVTVGLDHACALFTTGGVMCWGNGYHGQLGNGSSMDRYFPVGVIGLGSGVAAISAGHDYTCAVLTSGAAKCWGYNGYGTLGNNSTADNYTAADVSGLDSGVTVISAGHNHTCAVLMSGKVKCWGFNNHGQLGNNSTASSYIPVDVSGLNNGFAAVSVGKGHTCAILTTGGAKCWGDNYYGELGNNSTTDSYTPVASWLVSGVVAISAGSSFTCALLATGAVKCWGYHGYGELGNGSFTPSDVPVDVSGLGSGVAAISAGMHHTCALLSTGAVKCWGWNLNGQLGNGSNTDSNCLLYTSPSPRD